ncbi:hypothetical protein ACL02R_15150 [Streptomyces sp. MS19]|uniref:hypothetical protein n=1 Tax=Streptomyces sp. MS19 TaxID=3385972 RepID=UPI0039A32F7B
MGSRNLRRLISGAVVLGSIVVAVPVLSVPHLCWRPPQTVAEWAEDPAAATAALDPGTPSRPGATDLPVLLRMAELPSCADGPDGADLLGQALVAAATGRTVAEQDEPPLPHTEAMARTATRVVEDVAGRYLRIEGPLAVHMARVLAAYARDVSAVLWLAELYDQPETADPVLEGEAEFHPQPQRPGWVTGALVRQLAADPLAYAVLDDAFRADTAAWLDSTRIDSSGRVVQPDGEPLAPGRYGQFGEVTIGLAVLASGREHALLDSGADVDDYDRQVLDHTRGTFAPGTPATGDPDAPGLTGAATSRPASGPADTGHHLDGHAQVLAMVQQWARDRGISADEDSPHVSALLGQYLGGVMAVQMNAFDDL